MYRLAFLTAALLPAFSEDYGDAYDKAVRLDRPLVVFVRCPARAVAGCVTCRHDGYPGFVDTTGRYDGVVVGLPDGKGGIDEVARTKAGGDDRWVHDRLDEAKQKRQFKVLGRQVDFGQRPVYTPGGTFAPGGFSLFAPRTC